MIQRISLYLFRQIFIAFLFSGLAVSFVVLFTQSFRMLSFVIDNSSSLLVFFKLMALLLPGFLPLIIPISVGIAVLFIYHKFAIDSEIVVMRAAGISPVIIAAPSMALAGIALVIGLALTMWVSPKANAALVSLQYKVRDEYSAVMIKPGAFNDIAEGLTFFARRRSAGGGLEDILVHDVRNPARPITIMAKRGVFSVENNAPQVTVFQGKRQEVDVASGRLQQLNFDRYVLDFNLLKSEKRNRATDPRELSIGRLVQAMNTSGVPDKTLRKMKAELHQRIAGPFLSLTFAIIAVTTILVGDFNRRGMTRRVLLAAISIIVVQASMIGLVTQTGQNVWATILMYAVIFIPLIPCFYLLNLKTLLACQKWLPKKKVPA